FFTTKESGTGLGLSLTHQTVQQHGGRLECESRPRAGTTFRSALPGSPPPAGLDDRRIPRAGAPLPLPGDARPCPPTGRAADAGGPALLAQPPLPHLREPGGEAGAAHRPPPAFGGARHRTRQRAAPVPARGGADPPGDPPAGRRADHVAEPLGVAATLP